MSPSNQFDVIRTFLSLSINLIILYSSQSVVRNRLIVRQKDIGKADAEKSVASVREFSNDFR